MDIAHIKDLYDKVYPTLNWDYYKQWTGLTSRVDQEAYLDVNDERLEYIRDVADQLFPEIDYEKSPEGGLTPIFKQSLAVEEFIKIFNWGAIDQSTKDDRYDCVKSDDENPLREMILARGLDLEKMWFLCLWAKNIAETTRRITKDSWEDDIKELKGKLTCMEVNSFELIVYNNADKVFDTKNPNVAEYLKRAITAYESKPKAEIIVNEDFPLIDFDKPIELEAKYKYFIFYLILYPFLLHKKPDKRHNKWTKDTKFLIGRLCYAVGLSDDKRLLEFWKKSKGEFKPAAFLNGQISGMKEDDITNFNNPFYKINFIYNFLREELQK